MRRSYLVALLCCATAVAVSACSAGPKSPVGGSPVGLATAPVLDPVVTSPQTQEVSTATDQTNSQASSPETKREEIVPEVEVMQLLDEAHRRPYTMTWEVTGVPDPNGWGNGVLYRTLGRTGVRPNGDWYVLLQWDGFLHLGNQAWYLYMVGDQLFNDPAETGHLHQRPGIQSWEAIKPDQLGVLDGILRNSTSFVRVRTGEDSQQWISATPAQKSSLELFGEYRTIVEFWVTVRQIDKVYLPVRFHLTWWDAKLISFDGIYDWNPPTFPQVSEAKR